MMGLFLRYVLPALTLAGLLGFGVHKYNEGIRVEAVAAALEEERAFTVPKIANLEATVLELDATIADIKEKSDAARAKLLAENAIKQKDLGNALTKLKQSNIALAKLHSDNTDFLRMLDTIASDNRINDPASASARLIKLGAAYAQCEKEYRAESIEHAGTLERLGEALAVVRALKN